MIYKFRSMTTHSEDAGARLAAKEDARITPVGRVIRPFILTSCHSCLIF